MRSHRLTAPAADVLDAAVHMLAVQSQEFWGGRWALATRTQGAPSIRDTDALFDSGALVRSWTQRGTLHIVPAQDLGWMLEVTGARQLRAAAPRYREHGLDEHVLARVERSIRSVLRGGNALTRAELFEVLEAAGIATAAQRGAHAVQNLALRGIVCQGPVVRRAEGISREQRFVLSEEHITASAQPADPLAELFARYVDGHGPATLADFAWWSGVTLTMAREAAVRAAGRVNEVEQGVFCAMLRPRRSGPDHVRALAPFEEYYLSYADRSSVGTPESLAAIGPTNNGMVRPILLAAGRAVGTWRPSTAIGRHEEPPEIELFEAVDAAELAAALERYAAFVGGISRA